MSGRVAKGITIRGVGEPNVYKLPHLYEAAIPDSRDEVATPEDVDMIERIRHFKDKFNSFREDAEVLLLLGRDNPEIIATKTHTQIAPIVHETPLGWALVGESNPSKKRVSNRTLWTREHMSSESVFCKKYGLGRLPETDGYLFKEYQDDEQPGLSLEDIQFLDMMQENMIINSEGHIQAPLPFKGQGDPTLPDNKKVVFKRTNNTLRRLKGQPFLQSILDSMDSHIKHKHVEVVPQDEIEITDGKGWHLPIFVALHPRKKPRLVFDSAASYGGTSLNSKMLSGPDENNRLRDVLLRFREGECGFIADVEAMFYQFHVDPQHRDYMRFWWWENNDPSKPLILYRARVHIFGNTGSPAVSNRAFRLTTDKADPQPDPEVKKYIEKHFYVDDGCGSASSAKGAIKIIQGARDTLSQFGIRLHKIVASDPEVVMAFPESEIAKDVAQIDFDSLDDFPMQKTLGVAWDIKTDKFVMKVNIPSKEFTRRGVLSVINSIYDPIGIAAPVSLRGRLFQRSVIPKKDKGHPEVQSLDWDDPLPSSFQSEWEEFKRLLPQLTKLTMPRSLTPSGFGPVIKSELHCFSDASEEAIGYAIYLRSVNDKGQVHVAFVTGGNKVAPQSATSIPRLELCAALQGTHAAQDVCFALERKPDNCFYYSDSKVVLGYLSNTEKRFARYITRRVNLILKVAKEWHYIDTTENPADLASRPATPSQLLNSNWLRGPEFLWSTEVVQPQTFTALSPEELPEIVTETRALVSKRSEKGIFDTVFNRLSNWRRMVNVAKTVQKALKRLGTIKKFQHSPSELLIKDAQEKEYSDVIHLLSKGKPLPESHPLESLAPVLHNGLLRVGGRLDRAKMPFDRKHPYLIPQNHPISKAILSYFHIQGGHQGRHITHGLIRQNGFHLENGRQLIRQFLKDCFICRRLRANLANQIMADLPEDRLESCPPFTNCGLDVAGPWKIQRGKATRRTPGEIKIWVLLITCLSSRAIHVELLSSLDTPTFKNALSRFIAIRGTCKRLRSDQGSNFIGAQSENQEADVDVKELQKSMNNRGIEWEFNPPQASHFGGVWERKIGALKRVLEGTLVLMGPRRLNYDELHTFVVEAASIVNSTPLWEVSDDPNDPQPLTPAMLLTLRDSPHPAPPEEFSEDDMLTYGKSRWRRVQYLADQFWVRWRRDYLQLLQERSKWTKKRDNIKRGDIVLLREKNTKRNTWPLGRISKVKLSKDEMVRSLDVVVKKQSSSGAMKSYCYNRPISECILLSSLP